MKRLPFYISQVIMYVLIGIGLWRFLDEYKQVVTIHIPQSTQTSTTIPIVPLVIVSIVVFIICGGIGLQLLAVFWEWFKKNKTAIMFPVLLITIGFLTLIRSGLLTIQMYIETNAAQFINNIEIYANSTHNLMWWIIGGTAVGIIGLVYDLIRQHLITE